MDHCEHCQVPEFTTVLRTPRGRPHTVAVRHGTAACDTASPLPTPPALQHGVDSALHRVGMFTRARLRPEVARLRRGRC